MRATIYIPLLLVGMAAGLLISESEVQAATITVTTIADEVSTNGQCSLREALDNANSDTAGRPDCVAGSGADTIGFTVTGTIVLGSQLIAIGNLTITGPGGGITLSGNDQGRVLLVDIGAMVNLQNLTVTHGVATLDLALLPFSGGGGIQNRGGLTLINCIVSDNIASASLLSPFVALLSDIGSGGGILNTGTLILMNSTVSDNVADMSGGGIYNIGTLILMNSTVSDNGVFFASFLFFPLSSTPANGGGIANSGTVSLIASTVSNNQASSTGGGLDNRGRGQVTLANSTVQGNTANNGGGIFNSGFSASTPSTVTLINSTLADNSTRGRSLGLLKSVAGNLVNTGGGKAFLRNTIVAITSRAVAGGNCSGPITDQGHNLQFPGASCGATIPSLNPLLGPLADNGGPTLTLALQAGSPAINAGDTSVCLADPIDNQDQRGVTRIIEQSPFCDIGAFEFGKPIQPDPT